MTNQEYLIIALNNEIDDDGAAREAVIHYNIACPYTLGDKRALCRSHTTRMSRETCVQCKEAWLNAQADESEPEESSMDKDLISRSALLEILKHLEDEPDDLDMGSDEYVEWDNMGWDDMLYKIIDIVTEFPSADTEA